MNIREERFLRIVSNLAETPASFHPAFEGIKKAEDIERIIVIPKQEYPLLRTIFNIQLPFGWRVVPQRVMIFYTDRIEIHALESSGKLECEKIVFDRIFSVGIGSHLLYAYLDLSWIENGEIIARRIEFNAVGEAIIRERLDQIRERTSQIRAGTVIDGDLVQAALQDKSIPIKFRNYATFSLLPDEKIAQIFYQSAIRGKKMFGPSQSPNRLFTLTNRHLIVFDEDPSVASNYSIVTHFYPLNGLRQVKFETGAEHDTVSFGFSKNGIETSLIYPLQNECRSLLQDNSILAAQAG